MTSGPLGGLSCTTHLQPWNLDELGAEETSFLL